VTSTGRGDANVIVGAGQAGAHAAIAMRRAGFEGRITLLGDEGEAPYDRTPLSKAFLTGADDTRLTRFFDAVTYEQERIEVRLATVVEAIEPASGRIRIAGGDPLPYDRLILATGSRPRTLAVPGAEHVVTLRTGEDARRLRQRLRSSRRVVCIGAGVIGLEIASAARASGCQVTVVEVGEAVMSRSLAPQLGEHVAALHVQAGVELMFDSDVVAIEPGHVTLRNGLQIAADTVVAGVGVQRNTALAAAAGIEVARGILTDAGGSTNLAQIFGAGEVAEYFSARTGTHIALESWRHAQDHGGFVGRVAAGADETYDEVPWFWSDQHGSNIQVAGDGRSARRTLFRGDPSGRTFSAFLLDDASRLTGAFGLNAGRDISAALRMMRRGGRVDPDVLTDASVTPQRLLATALLPESAG
jgi:NADPH-dependent 2,4-dienoyl-CoA reductase/sulfur reductase-like enzyme